MIPQLLSPQKGQLPEPSPKYLSLLPAELMVSDWAERTRALVLGGSWDIAALWVSLSKLCMFWKAVRLDARNWAWL